MPDMETGARPQSRHEARRVMGICNACRYCEGFCPVFPAMIRRRQFDGPDLDYLANLCHHCGACYQSCQYAPPHEFNVNVPLTLASVRNQSWQDYAWPTGAGRLFRRNGLIVALVTALALSFLILSLLLLQEPDLLNAIHTGPGAFYLVIGRNLMVLVAGSVFLFALLAMYMGVRNFWLATGGKGTSGHLWAALVRTLEDVATLRHLGGGHGEGCNTADETVSNWRRYFHQFTLWGFLLCFAATCVAFLYENAFGYLSPFPYTSLPVLLGTVGGLGLLVGPAGLFWIKLRSNSQTRQDHRLGMETAFLMLLFATSLTGLLLMLLRATPAMSFLLAVHLGFVLALFLLLPYSKFVHGVYRFAALLRYHQGR